MDENQEKFISWIAAKLGATDEEDLKKKLQTMGGDGIKQAYSQFLQEGDKEQPASYSQGGKFDYINCLQAFKKGGKMGCGCGGMKLKMDDGGVIEGEWSGLKADRAGKGSSKTKKLTPKKVVMGQGMATIAGIGKNQSGGTLQPNTLKGKTAVGENTQSPSKQQGNGQQQGPSPEQIMEQKTDERANKLLNKKKGVGEVLTPMQILMEQVRPKQIKAKPEKTMKLLSDNDTTLGIAKKQYGGLVKQDNTKVRKDLTLNKPLTVPNKQVAANIGYYNDLSDQLVPSPFLQREEDYSNAADYSYNITDKPISRLEFSAMKNLNKHQAEPSVNSYVDGLVYPDKLKAQFSKEIQDRRNRFIKLFNK